MLRVVGDQGQRHRRNEDYRGRHARDDEARDTLRPHDGRCDGFPAFHHVCASHARLRAEESRVCFCRGCDRLRRCRTVLTETVRRTRRDASVARVRARHVRRNGTDYESFSEDNREIAHRKRGAGWLKRVQPASFLCTRFLSKAKTVLKSKTKADNFW